MRTFERAPHGAACFVFKRLNCYYDSKIFVRICNINYLRNHAELIISEHYLSAERQITHCSPFAHCNEAYNKEISCSLTVTHI